MTALTYRIAISAATEATVNRLIQNRVDGMVFEWDIDSPYYFEANAYFDTEAEAQAFAAQFPKSIKLRDIAIIHYGYDANGIYTGTRKGYASVRIDLGANKVNQGINETGIARIRALARTCAKLGITLEQDTTTWGNCSPRSIQEYGWTK